MKKLVKREDIKEEEFVDWLDENSRNVVESFLSSYKSQKNHRSAIRILLYHVLVKDDVRDLTYVDFKKALPVEKITNKEKLTSQESYRHRFFQYLYALDHLNNPSGFEEVMHKQQLINEFSKDKKKNLEIDGIKIPVNALTVEELMAIQNILEVDSTKIDTLKMQFCWFALFDLGLPIEEVRNNITSENFSNGKITTSIGTFDIPEKYHLMFLEFSKRESNHNGFTTLDSLVANLGKVAKLPRKIKPHTIKNTRKTTLINCGNCFRDFANDSANWTSINSHIVCVECADTIKKKLDFEIKIKDIENTDVDTKENQEISLLFTYNDLKDNLENTTVDYLKLHQFQIEIGKLGEAYAYEFECKNLTATKYLHLIDQSKAENPANGYDLLSYTVEGIPLHIEVKATTGKEEKFYLTENERNTAIEMKKKGLKYVVYFIKEIMSDKPQLKVIEDITANEDYVFITKNWEVSRKK